MQDESDDKDTSTKTINFVAKYLKDIFGDKPLSEEELQEKIEKVRKHCYFAYYMFASNISEDVRRQCMSNAMQHTEMPIDLQSIELLTISDEDKEIMVMSNAAYTRLVLIDAAHTDKYSEFCNKILANYVAKYRDNIVFVRGFND